MPTLGVRALGDDGMRGRVFRKRADGAAEAQKTAARSGVPNSGGRSGAQVLMRQAQGRCQRARAKPSGRGVCTM